MTAIKNFELAIKHAGFTTRILDNTTQIAEFRTTFVGIFYNPDEENYDVAIFLKGTSDFEGPPFGTGSLEECRRIFATACVYVERIDVHGANLTHRVVSKTYFKGGPKDDFISGRWIGDEVQERVIFIMCEFNGVKASFRDCLFIDCKHPPKGLGCQAIDIVPNQRLDVEWLGETGRWS